MKAYITPIVLAAALLAFAPIVHAQTTQTYYATSENTRILGPSELQAKGHEIVSGRGVVHFGGISNGQIFGTIDTHINPATTPNSQRGSVIYDPVTLDHTFISRVPAGSSSTDYYQVLDMDGSRTLASHNNGTGDQNYYYHTPTDGYTQLATPSWVTGSFGSMHATGISGQYIAGSTLHYDSGWQYSGFVYDTSADSYLSFVPPGALGIDINGIDGNTVVGSYSYQREDGLYDDRYFTYDIGSGAYTDLSLDPSQFYISGITGGIVYGSSDDVAAYYDLNSDTLTVLDFSDDFSDSYFRSTITGIEGNTIVGNFDGGEESAGFIINVPEPSGTILLGLTGALAIWRRRRAA